MTPWFAANFTLQCNAQMRKAARPFSFCAAPPETKGGRLLSSSASWWKRTKAYLLLPTEDLRFVNHTVAKAVERDYGALFFGFRSSRLWSFNVELLFGVATGVVIGVTLDSSDPCGVFVFGWILVALSLIECLLAFSVRPYCAAVDFVMLAVVSGLSTVSQVVALVDDSDVGQSASVALGLLASSFQLLCSVLLAIEGLNGENIHHPSSFLGKVEQYKVFRDFSTRTIHQRRRPSPLEGRLATQSSTSVLAIRRVSAQQQEALAVLIRAICEAPLVFTSSGSLGQCPPFFWVQ